MVFTLHRYMFRELLRIFILATIGLTLILSLGMILQPVQEFGVGPRQAVTHPGHLHADHADVRAADGGAVRLGPGVRAVRRRQRDRRLPGQRNRRA